MPEVSLPSKYFSYWANEFLIGYHSFDLTFLSGAKGRFLKGRFIVDHIADIIQTAVAIGEVFIQTVLTEEHIADAAVHALVDAFDDLAEVFADLGTGEAVGIDIFDFGENDQLGLFDGFGFGGEDASDDREILEEGQTGIGTDGFRFTDTAEDEFMTAVRQLDRGGDFRLAAAGGTVGVPAEK